MSVVLSETWKNVNPSFNYKQFKIYAMLSLQEAFNVRKEIKGHRLKVNACDSFNLRPVLCVFLQKVIYELV